MTTSSANATGGPDPGPHGFYCVSCDVAWYDVVGCCFDCGAAGTRREMAKIPNGARGPFVRHLPAAGESTPPLIAWPARR